MSTITLPPPSPRTFAADAPAPARGRLERLLRGRTDEEVWVRPALLGLLAVTAVLYLWGLGASGWANSFYSAAVQAGSTSWKAFFFGSSDAASSITVDKPPASLWVMALSVRVFGLSSWSILIPQALQGVAAVGFLYAAVRRWTSPAAGLVAGAVLALSPVAALMFRFNNPDALLVLLLTVGAYAILRALEAASTRWLLLASALVGFGFLTKMLQALLVVPAFALVYLLAAPAALRRRLDQLALAGLVLVASAGWWVAIVELVPASARPYIGGSQNNSVLDLIFGYNGFGRLTGNETGSVGGGGGAGGRWGATGWTRMFNTEYGGQISWLLPAAVVLLAAIVVFRWRAPRTDRVRAAGLLWGGWMLVTAAVFSLGQGIIHSYYTVALAPAIGGLIGVGGWMLWSQRHRIAARLVLAATVVVSAVWAYVLLGRTPDWNPWLGPVVVVLAAVAAAGLLLPERGRGFVAKGAVAVGLVGVLAGPVAYSVATAATPHAGALPAAGPAVAGGFPGGGRGGPAGFAGGPAGGTGAGPGGQAAGAMNGGFLGPMAGGGAGAAPGGQGAGAAPAGGAPTGGALTGGGGIGGLLNGSTPSDELVALLEAGSDQYTWVAATVGANQAAGYQLATGDAVMPIGGFNGTDPSPTLAEFQELVAQGRIHYFVAGGGGGPGGGDGTANEIATWVESTFDATTVGGVTLYDLTS